jgi:hypothetical protein
MGRNKGSTSAGMDLIPGGLKASKQSYTLVPFRDATHCSAAAVEIAWKSTYNGIVVVAV